MNPKDEMYINRYKLDKNRYIETVRICHEMIARHEGLSQGILPQAGPSLRQ